MRQSAGLSLKGDTQSGFREDPKRKQYDHKPMMRTVVNSRYTNYAFWTGRARSMSVMAIYEHLFARIEE
jgi:hypothetical protein